MTQTMTRMAAAEDQFGVSEIVAAQAYLTRFASSLAQQPADRDDLVQETLACALRARAQFRPGSSMRAWLTTILRHTFFTMVRHRRLRAHLSLSDYGGDVRSAPSRSPEPARRELDGASRLEDVEQHLDERLLSAIVGLPDAYREPLLLVALQSLTYREISARLGIPEGTVMSRLHRARARVRRALEAAPAPRSVRSREGPRGRLPRPAERVGSRVGVEVAVT